MELLVYQSRVNRQIGSDELFRIIETSARNNPARQITGFLVFAHDHFVQLIEGPTHSLDALLDDLAQDPRHCDLEILERRDVSDRTFPNWRMERLAVIGDDTAPLVQALEKAGVGQMTIDRATGSFAHARVA